MKPFISDGAEGEIIGHIIILAITILGIGMITIFGVPAISNLEDMANSKNVEQAFTVLDSRASREILGDSPLQITNIDIGGGTISIEPNSTKNPSYIVVNSSSFNVTIPMGKIKYYLGDRIVSYEGGGVWAQYPGGGTVMLSPPEFHYNGWTLTLPVININGNASIGGKGTMVVSFKKNATIIQYPNASIPGRTNPVEGSAIGKVNVTIVSDYYNSWADYARTLSYTNVLVMGKTAIIELNVISPMGTFVSIPDTITMRDINLSNPAPITNLSFVLYKVGTGGSCGARDWFATTTKGLATLKIGVEHTNPGCKYKMNIEYTNSTGSEEEWNSIPLVQNDPERVDFLNKSLNLTYDDPPCPSWSPITCSSSTNYSSYDLIQHYILLMGPDITFQTDPGNKVDSTTSSFTLFYDPGPGALTYLHITENRVEVGIS